MPTTGTASEGGAPECSLSRSHRARIIVWWRHTHYSLLQCVRLRTAAAGYAARSPFLSLYGVSEGGFGRARTCIHVRGRIQVHSESGRALSPSDSIRAKDTCVATRHRVGRRGLTQNQPTGSGRRRYPIPEPYSRMCALSGGLIVVKLQREGQATTTQATTRGPTTQHPECSWDFVCNAFPGGGSRAVLSPTSESHGTPSPGQHTAPHNPREALP